MWFREQLSSILRGCRISVRLKKYEDCKFSEADVKEAMSSAYSLKA